MKLYGSTTSPFVRRIRLLMVDTPYEFINLDIFSEQGHAELNAHNPANKVPFLIDDEQTIFDSRIIYRYLTKKFQMAELSWSQENLLTVIDAANDSFVALLLAKRSGFDVHEDKLLFNLQHQRIEAVFHYLETMLQQGQFAQWHYCSICLYCLLDWIDFRELYDFSGFALLSAFHKTHAMQAGVAETYPH